MNPLEHDLSALPNLRAAVRDLESSIYSGREVKRVYMLLDAIASAAQEFFPSLFGADEELSPEECFERLTAVGLDASAVAATRELEKLSSKKWYDNDKKEADLENADRNRSLLFQALESLVKKQTAVPPSQMKLFPEDAKHEQG